MLLTTNIATVPLLPSLAPLYFNLRQRASQCVNSSRGGKGEIVTHRRGLQSLGNKLTSQTFSFSPSEISVNVLLSSFKQIYDKRPSTQFPLYLPSTGKSLVEETPHRPDLVIMRVNCSLPFPCKHPTQDRYGCCASVALPFY